jgi:hypothetical protein
MTKNLERFTNDLERLISKGDMLEYAMISELQPDDFKKKIESVLDKEEADKLIANLPIFRREYQTWYSESLYLLQQLLPARVDDFAAFYEKPRNRKEVNYGNYTVRDYLDGLIVSRGASVIVDAKAAITKFQQQVQILKSARQRFKSSLFEIKQLVQADMFDSELDAARELNKNKFSRAAGTVVGVVLEKHLAQVCQDHNLKIRKKRPVISDFNEALKSNDTIDTPQWRHIGWLADIRNLCTHRKDREPTADEVSDLIDGANRVLKTIV